MSDEPKENTIFENTEALKIVKFGFGDVNISSGFIDDPDNDFGSVSFAYREPVEIGTIGECFGTNKDAELRFIFTKTESIDVLIRALENAKQLMLSGECSRFEGDNE